MLASSELIHTNARRLKEEQPALRARDIAHKLGISEGLLVASSCGEGATRLIRLLANSITSKKKPIKLTVCWRLKCATC